MAVCLRRKQHADSCRLTSYAGEGVHYFLSTVSFQASGCRDGRTNFRSTYAGNKVMAQVKMSIKTAPPVASVSSSTHKEVKYRAES